MYEYNNSHQVYREFEFSSADPDRLLMNQCRFLGNCFESRIVCSGRSRRLSAGGIPIRKLLEDEGEEAEV